VGKVTLSEDLQLTLDAVTTHGPINAAALVAMPEFLEVQPTAMNNRLERLRELGFLKRDKDGRANKYTAIEPKK